MAAHGASRYRCLKCRMSATIASAPNGNRVAYRESKMSEVMKRRRLTLLLACAASLLAAHTARATDPIKIGFSMSLTGAVANTGRIALAAQKLWESDINAKGGLLGRPVQLVYYDDQ